MTRVLVYRAHPGRQYSHANAAMEQAAAGLDGVTDVDLYAEYPRLGIDVAKEQNRLRDHDTIVFQCPFFWYSTPSIIKEWQDLVLEHGFAYGSGGDALKGKRWAMALTCAGPADAYQPGGYNTFTMRTLLSPLEQTANLCKMRFVAPYVLHASLKARNGDQITRHAAGWVRYLTALRDETLDLEAAEARGVVQLHDFDEVIR